MFIPTTKDEANELGWNQFDIILVTGDCYIDHYASGVALLGKLLIKNGYKVGIIAQPDTNSSKDITRLGEPLLFWGVTAGAVDSMISNYTATKKKRNQDDLTAGGINNKRPDRATIVYCNLIKRHYKNSAPIVIGGVEASLRRIAHYDYWDNSIRRPIIFDAKADILVYGMAERTILELTDALKNKKEYKELRGICYIDKNYKKDFIELPSFEDVKESKEKFIDMFNLFYKNSDPLNSKGLYQSCDKRYLIHNPPALPLTEKEIDEIYEMDFERKVHPYYEKQGKVKALDTIQFSITTHRGCFGECNFCSISLHQGRAITSRSIDSIIRETKKLTDHPNFTGIITLYAPTANMYKSYCNKMNSKGGCKDKRCLYPIICKNLTFNHTIQMELLKRISNIKKVKKVFITAGIRYDMIVKDRNRETYLYDLLKDHTSGQLKIAPEHTEENVLQLMGKPSKTVLQEFVKLFNFVNQKLEKKKFLTFYFIAAHPGCKQEDMERLKIFISKNLKILPEQVQVFTPSPSSYSTLMYYSKINPFTGKKIFVEKDVNRAEKQKKTIHSYSRIKKNKGQKS